MSDAQIARTLGTCKTCRFFVLDPWSVNRQIGSTEKPIVTAPNVERGQCRKNGPSKASPHWPIVKTAGWCGRFVIVMPGFEKIAIPDGFTEYDTAELSAIFPFEGFWVA